MLSKMSKKWEGEAAMLRIRVELLPAFKFTGKLVKIGILPVNGKKMVKI